MQSEKEIQPTKKSKTPNVYIRVQRETKKLILSELKKLNQKEFGKPITPNQYVAYAVSLMTPSHHDELKTQSLSNQDRLNQRYQEYCKVHGKISMDEFLGTLLI